MIKTVTLNPAMDKTVEINGFTVGTVNRIAAVRLDAGGKGINVAKVLKVLEGQSQALGILAGHNGQVIKAYLDEQGIDNDFVFVAGETRTNLKVVDFLNHTHTDINEPGAEINPQDLQELQQKIFAEITPKSILILSGSVPVKMQRHIYQAWILQARASGARTILDADGELLQEGVKAAPSVIKPNIHELERLLNRQISSPGDAVVASRSLLELGIGLVVVSMGEDGALFVQKDQAIQADGLKVEVKSTVGAGDAMVAALALALDRQYSLEETVALSVATSAAQVMTPGTEPPRLSDVRVLTEKVRFRYV